MLHIKPVKEADAPQEIKNLYASIRTTFETGFVPLAFQYLAAFPEFFQYVWLQSQKNVLDPGFRSQVADISAFASSSIQEIYHPSGATMLFLSEIRNPNEIHQLTQFVEKNIPVHASVYMLSVAFREGLKGKYLGIKQLSHHLSDQDKQTLDDISEGFYELSQKNVIRDTLTLAPIAQTPVRQDNTLSTSPYQEFFKRLQWDMDLLVQKEEYLYRRVELERFTLSKLPLLPHPIESSFASVAAKHSEDPYFPELLYLISEYLPTQAPLKLMATATMKCALEIAVTSSTT